MSPIRILEPGETVRVRLPFSAACRSWRIAGRTVEVRAAHLGHVEIVGEPIILRAVDVGLRATRDGRIIVTREAPND